MRRTGAIAALLALAVAGCSAQDPPRTPAACLVEAPAVVTALQAPPEAVRLGGFRISTCVARASTDADLQTLGLSLTSAAERLGVQARDARDAAAARRLGFLAAAVQRGAETTQGIAMELARRVARATVKLDGAAPALTRALERGIADGGRLG